MAELIIKHLVEQAGLSERFTISSAATTMGELSNDIYPNAKAELKRHGIPLEHRRARQIRSDEEWDLIIAMDMENLNDIKSIAPEKKVKLLMSFAGEDRAVSSPWYTRDFARAYNDIYRGCEGLLRNLLR